jgi:hypothetical protein
MERGPTHGAGKAFELAILIGATRSAILRPRAAPIDNRAIDDRIIEAGLRAIA